MFTPSTETAFRTNKRYLTDGEKEMCPFCNTIQAIAWIYNALKTNKTNRNQTYLMLAVWYRR